MLGWKEFEMEVVRDTADNCIIVCSIENLDPMGVHTGDSITVAPAQTLTDKEYQRLRDASIAVLRKIGVDTGGSNVQFGVNSENGRVVVIEMNPRVSRSSALASKATGFPIAKVAAKLAVGYTLDELRNEITGGATPASFEPTIDYVVTKIPRFAFEKFPAADARLTTQMKSVGEVMAIGRTFQESLQKALRGLETGKDGLNPGGSIRTTPTISPRSSANCASRGPSACSMSPTVFAPACRCEEIYALTHIDRWFLDQIAELVEIEAAKSRRRTQGARRRAHARTQAQGFFRCAPGDAARYRRSGGAHVAPRVRRASGLQARRFVRGRVRDDDCVSVFDLRGRVRGRADRARQDHGARRRPEPHRPGHRVRLLLRACRACAARGRLRDDHGQLQSGDRLDRLRHVRSPVLRAADARRRARNHRQGKAQGRDRAVRRTDAAEAGARARSERRADHRHVAGFDRSGRGPRALPEDGRRSSG